jgi:hypothetical protein
MVVVEECAPEELEEDPVGIEEDPVGIEEGAVGVEEGAEELGLISTRVATGGPGNVYTMGGLSICVAISDISIKIKQENVVHVWGQDTRISIRVAPRECALVVWRRSLSLATSNDQLDTARVELGASFRRCVLERDDL